MKKCKIVTILFVLLLSTALVGCKNSTSKDGASTNVSNSKEYLSKITEKTSEDKNPIATIEIEDIGVIKVELYPEIAPNTVRNFISLSNDNFYNGLIFHRVITDFMIQGGDPDGNGTGGPDYSIYGEFSNNDFENNISHEKGVISMARSRDNNSAGSQFFIMHKESTQLNGDYAAFGKVIEGIEIVDEIASKETKNEKPIADVVIKSISVDTFGVEYKEPLHYKN